MQLRVGDDADRMRARRERDQPDPVAVADQVVGREPARRRVAARAPGGIVGPVVDVDPLADPEPRALASWPFGSASPSLRLSRPARPQASTSQRACARVVLRRRGAQRTRAAPPSSAELDVAHGRAVRRSATPRRARSLGRGSSRRCRGRSGSSARRGSGSRRSRRPRRCRAGLPTKKKRKPNFFSCAARGAPSGRAPWRSSWRRSRPSTRRPCAPPPGTGWTRRSSTRTSRSGNAACSCSASVRPARPPPVMTTSLARDAPAHALRASMVATWRTRQGERERRRERHASDASSPAAIAMVSKNGSAPAIALPARVRALQSERSGRRARSARARADQSSAAMLRSLGAGARDQRAREQAVAAASRSPAGRSPRRRRRPAAPASRRPALARRLEQAGAEAGVERGQRSARLVAAGGDRPVAGGGVVHRVVERVGEISVGSLASVAHM